MSDIVDSILGYFSDDDDKRQVKPAKRVKQYRKKRPVVSVKKSDSTIYTGYATEHEDSDEGPDMKALAKQFSSVSTYSKFIRNGKQTEFGSYVVNDSDKPYIESGNIKNGKMVIKRQQRPYYQSL